MQGVRGRLSFSAHAPVDAAAGKAAGRGRVAVVAFEGEDKVPAVAGRDRAAGSAAGRVKQLLRHVRAILAAAADRATVVCTDALRPGAPADASVKPTQEIKLAHVATFLPLAVVVVVLVRVGPVAIVLVR